MQRKASLIATFRIPSVVNVAAISGSCWVGQQVHVEIVTPVRVYQTRGAELRGMTLLGDQRIQDLSI